jgi:hypothetical protein
MFENVLKIVAIIKMNKNYNEDSFLDRCSYSLLFCSAWSKAKAQRLTKGFGVKHNTKFTLNNPPTHNHHHTPPHQQKGLSKGCEILHWGLKLTNKSKI